LVHKNEWGETHHTDTEDSTENKAERVSKKLILMMMNLGLFLEMTTKTWSVAVFANIREHRCGGNTTPCD